MQFKDKHGRPIPKTSETLIKKNYDVSFMVLCAVDFCAVKLFYVEKGVSTLQLKDSITISTTEIVEGFDIHKSLNYVIVTTKDGKVSLFSVKLKEFVFSYTLEMRIRSRFA